MNTYLPNLKRLALCALLLFTVASTAHAGPEPLNALISVDNATANEGDARVRVVHLSPDAPDVDVRVDGGLAFAGIPFQGVTDYAALPAGTYQVQVEPAGADNAGPFVIDAELTLNADTDYTVIASDVLANITPIVLVDDNTAPAAGFGHVRFFHGSPDAPAVDIALTNGPVLIPNASFQDFTGYLPVPAGSYNLEVRLAGTDTVVLTLPGTVVPDGAVVTAYANGLVADGFADRTVYLGDDRFRVEINWTDDQGVDGFARPSKLQETTSNFWFFNPENIEVTLKVLDGVDINGYWWVFFGSLSNVAFTVNVTDRETGNTVMYENMQGTFASVGDTHALPAN